MIRLAKKDDAQQICDIYNHYIKNTVITFEEEPVTSIEIQNRIAETTSSFPWLLHEDEGRITGYAYATRWRVRNAYRYSAESTIYLKNGLSGKGIGTILYTNLLEELRKKGIHAVFGGIALPNEKSAGLHEKLGFKKVAHLSEVGFKLNKWIDVGYWELILMMLLLLR